VVLSFGSLFTYCGFYLLNRHVRSTTAIEPMQFMAGCTLFAALAVTPFALLGSNRGDFDQLGGSDWWYLLFAAVGLSTIAHGSMSWLHKYVVAARSSLIILASNVVAIAAAWWIHDEPITIAQAVGSAVVLGAVAAVVSRGPVPDPEPAL
jgi:drug/metabolite transporter (DMT)-like permease